MILPLENLRILLVEDDPNVAGMVQLVLKQAGFECRLATNAAEALSALKALGAKRAHAELVAAEAPRRQADPKRHQRRMIEVAPCQVLRPQCVVGLVEHKLEVGIEPQPHDQ